MSKKKSNKFEFKGFISVFLTDMQLMELENWGKGTPQELEDHLVVIIEHGYKIGFSFNDYTGAKMVALTCKDQGSVYYGYCFTLQHAEIGRLALACRWIVEDAVVTEAIPLPEESKKYQW